MRCLLRGRLPPGVGTMASEGESGPLGIANRYSSDDWWQHFIDLPYSAILKRIQWHLVFQSLLAVSVSIYQEITRALEPLPSTPLLLCSAVLGLLLVFRTNAAYERWQQGQQNAYLLRHCLQQLLRTMRPWLTEERFMRLQAQVSAFPRAIATHLTAKPGAGYIYGIGPRDLVTQISDDLTLYFAGSRVPIAGVYAHDRAQGHIDRALMCVGDMERLATEAVPRDYSRHTSRFLTVWMCSLPFVLLDCGRLMPVIVAIACWALLSIEEIGHTLEDPFNSPTQRIPVQAILESGGGEHCLAPPGKEAEGGPPVAPALWERRVAWEEAQAASAEVR
uniref:Uncharacterized protein n=1 Tax=Zooxanthella nutricula TaxID=1333877 RepID=A0A7S2KDA9_9DINO